MKKTNVKLMNSLLMAIIFSVSTGFGTANPAIIASWNFDSTVGNTFVDNSGHGYNATWTGIGVGLVSGIKEMALNCPGSGYEMIASNSLNDFNLNKFTIECWFYSNVPPSQISIGAMIFDFQAVTTNVRNGYGLYINPQGKVDFSLSSSTGSEWVSVISSSSIQAHAWNHIACSYDSSYLKVYVNGVLDASTAYKGTYVPPHADARIGCQTLTDGTRRCFVNGRIDELKLYNDALSADSVMAHYNVNSNAPVLIPYAPDPGYNRKPILKWHPVQGALNYTIQIDSVSKSSSAYIINVVSDTFYSVPADLPIGEIYWQVHSDLSNVYSGKSSFLILNDSVPQLIPINPDTQTNRRPQFAWHQSKGATSYRIQIDTSGNFNSPFISVPLSDTFFIPSIDLPIGRLLWRIGAQSNILRFSPSDTFWIDPSVKIGSLSNQRVSRAVSLSLVPKRGAVLFTYLIKNNGLLSLNICSLTGKKIVSLLNGYSSSGSDTYLWNGVNEQGKIVPNGCYMAVFVSDKQRICEPFSFIR